MKLYTSIWSYHARNDMVHWFNWFSKNKMAATSKMAIVETCSRGTIFRYHGDHWGAITFLLLNKNAPKIFIGSWKGLDQYKTIKSGANFNLTPTGSILPLKVEEKIFLAKIFLLSNFNFEPTIWPNFKVKENLSLFRL